jgi:carbon storage regulator
LSRKPGESIHIGDGIEIMIMQVRGDKVRIGIKAPRGVVVLRNELAEAAAREKIIDKSRPHI